MYSTQKIAFIDAYGNHDLETTKSGASTHFIISAVIVEKSKLPEVIEQAENIRKKYFQNGEIKSSTVSKKQHSKRLSIIEDISQLELGFISLIADKSLLYSEGLKRKQPFYKFLHKILYNTLYKSYPDLKIVQDKYGNYEFMDGFKKYVYKNKPLTLFDSGFEFVDSSSSVLVQVADFIAGTLSKYYDNKEFYPLSEEYFYYLDKIKFSTHRFPEHSTKYIHDLSDKGFDINESIAETSRRLATSYILLNNESDDKFIQYRVSCLKCLRLNFDINPIEYVSADEIIEFINDKSLNKVQFRRSIIAKLRDEKILISTNDKGYKLPATENNCIEYLNTCSNIISPMLHRIDLFVKEVKRSTGGKVDLLKLPAFNQIKKALSDENLSLKRISKTTHQIPINSIRINN